MMRLGVTRVPIPNTTVKPWAAEGTWLATARENRRLPEQISVRAQIEYVRYEMNENVQKEMCRVVKPNYRLSSNEKNNREKWAHSSAG